MGQKVHPIAFRLGNGRPWRSSWYSSKKDFAKNLLQDVMIREVIQKKIKDGGIADIAIERYSDQIVVKIFTSRPGVVIGREGKAIDDLKALLQVKVQRRDLEVKVEEIRKPDLEASLIAENIARQVEARIPYRRAAKKAIEKAIESGAKGCKIRLSGRLNGVDIARSEAFIEGNIPLHTIRNDIDFFHKQALTTYGVIGVKVWVYRGQFPTS